MVPPEHLFPKEVPVNTLDKIAKLKEGDEVVINGILYTRLDSDEIKEWKVSPYGLIGDYDQACYWLDSESLLDELVNTTDLTRPPVFKQDTPKMQGASILQGIEGHLLNWLNGIEPNAKALENALMLVRNLKALHSWLPEKW